MRSVCFKPLSRWLPGLVLLFLCQVAAGAVSTDLGVVGKVYPVAEHSLLDVLMERLKQAQSSGEFARIEQAARQLWQAYAQQPPGQHFPRVPKARTRQLDMSLTVEHDLADADDNVFAKAGTKVNPLAMMQLSKDILLFDATDAAQAAWARRYIAASERPIKPIVTAGPVLQLMQDWNVQLWFDQGGYLAKRFRIQYLPVVLRQRGELLELEEVVVHD